MTQDTRKPNQNTDDERRDGVLERARTRVRRLMAPIRKRRALRRIVAAADKAREEKSFA